MLILTRRIGESIYIGDDILVTVTRVQGNKVFVGITAPRNLRVDREEVRERILKELADAHGNTMEPVDDEPITSS